jgi:hypothetical protein
MFSCVLFKFFDWHRLRKKAVQRYQVVGPQSHSILVAIIIDVRLEFYC